MGDQLPEIDELAYQPEDAIANGFRGAFLTGSAGLLISAVQNTVARQNVGALGVFTKFGGTTAIFASAGATYGFMSAAAANLKEKRDMSTEATGAFFGGALVGIRQRSIAAVVGSGAAASVLMAVAFYTSRSFASSQREAEEQKFVRKDEIRKRFRRPLNETVNEIGEGRGIYPPGYDERRKERIKARYGIDVQEPYYKGEPAAVVP